MPHSVVLTPLDEEVELCFSSWVCLLLEPGGIVGVSRDCLRDALDSVEELQERELDFYLTVHKALKLFNLEVSLNYKTQFKI